MKLVLARKDHKCSLCGRKIAEGSKYWQYNYDKADPVAVNIKEHANCVLHEKEPIWNKP